MRALTCVLFLALACGDDDGGSDAGFDASFDAARDTGGLDAGFFDAGSDAPAPLMHVLFVGNSYTYFHNLPGVVSLIGNASGTPIEAEMVAEGGASLFQHLIEGGTGGRERILSGEFDAIVLQGQSMEASGLAFTVEMYGDILADTNNVWFATWARHGDFFADPEAGPAFMNASNERGYRDAAAIYDDTVARVGAAWELARMEMPEVRLHQDDLSHPRPEGTLLAACVIHQALTGRTPVLPETTPLDLDRDLAERLCALATRVTCPFETAECDGECIPVVDDPDNCGGCGIVCDGDDPCMGGSCGCSIDTQSPCNREYCAYLELDEANCGGCGVECSGGEACTGTCECPDTRVYDLFGVGLPPCDIDGSDRVGCNAAARDYCSDYACFTGGYAVPSGHAPTGEEAVCIADAEERTTTLAELATHEASCTDPLTPACVTAIHRYCVSEGFASGFGPFAETADDLSVTCLPSATLYTATTETLQGFASRCVPDPITCGVAAHNWCKAAFHDGGYGPVETDTVVCF